MDDALLSGLGLGFLVAAQVGPIWLLCARSVLRGRLATGLAVGAGAAVVDTAYACLGVAGAAPLLGIGALRLALGFLGAGVLVALGARTLTSALRIRAGGELEAEVVATAQALRTSLIATASNPLTIVSWAAIFAAASSASITSTTASTVTFLAGIGVGSFGWFTLLSVVLSALRRHVSATGLRLADATAGLGLLGFGGYLGYRTLND